MAKVKKPRKSSPRKLTPAMCAQIGHLVSYGYTQRTIAQMVGISEDTISMAKKDNPDLKRAFTVGKSITARDMRANIHKLAMTAESETVKLSASVKALELSEATEGIKDDKPSDSEILDKIVSELDGR